MILGIGFGLWGGLQLYIIGTLYGTNRERKRQAALEKYRREAKQLGPYR